MISLHVFRYKITYKNIRVNRHTNTNEAFREEAGKDEVSREVCQIRADGDDTLRYIKRDLLRVTPTREDGGLEDVDLQTSICLENSLKLRQDLKGYG